MEKVLNNYVSLFIFIIMFHTTCRSLPGNSTLMCKPTERAALLNFKHSLTLFDKYVSASWVDEECCNWQRVRCDNTTGHVLDLYLSGDGYNNTLELENTESLVYLLQLKRLELLDLSYNNLSSNSILASLGNLVTLKHLDLSENMFSGEIPASLANLLNLMALDLSVNKFSGEIPVTLANLSNLEVLDLSFNKFSGEIPTSLGNLLTLKHLVLSRNNFSIPSSFMFPPNLEYLRLYSNQLSGQIPISIGQLSKLTYLDISHNPMEGTVLSQLHFANLSNLTSLDMSETFLTLNMSSDWVPPFQLQTLNADDCKINGHLPPWLHTQKNLSVLELSNANISGIMPTWFHTLPAIYRVDLSNNKLSGSPVFPINFEEIDLSNNSFSGISPIIYPNAREVDLSNNLFSDPMILQYIGHIMPSLESLDLSNNQISGPIPKNIGHIMPSLKSLDLSNNQINGPIPKNIGHIMPSLESLDLSNNQINGTIPKSLCQITWLETLAIENNSISGVIPSCWANTSSLSLINLSHNKLKGHIPCFNSMEIKFYMHLNDNMLSGEIPSCLSDLTYLEVLDVGGNQLSGKIPQWFTGDEYGFLRILRLSGNNFSGIIPRQICSLSYLQLLDLGHNRFTGSIPPCLSNLTAMNSLDVADPSLDVDLKGVNVVIQGIEREYTSTLRYLVDIDLSCNYLMGNIPRDITNLSSLLSLNLSNNQLSGTIPQNIGGLKSLIALDLSNNKLKGVIPRSVAQLYHLSYLNLSYNNFSGAIPTGNQLQTLSDPTSIYAGNPYLCGDSLPKKCIGQINKQGSGIKDEGNGQDDDKREMMWFVLVVMSGVATGFWGVVGSLVLKRSWRHAFFRRVEAAYDWVYVIVALRMAKINKT